MEIKHIFKRGTKAEPAEHLQVKNMVNYATETHRNGLNNDHEALTNSLDELVEELRLLELEFQIESTNLELEFKAKRARLSDTRADRELALKGVNAHLKVLDDAEENNIKMIEQITADIKPKPVANGNVENAITKIGPPESTESARTLQQARKTSIPRSNPRR